MKKRLQNPAMLLAAGVALFAATIAAENLPAPLRGVSDPGVIATHQEIVPAGEQMIFEGRVYGVAFCGGKDRLSVLISGGISAIESVDWRENRIVHGSVIDSAAPGMQGLACVGSGGLLTDQELFSKTGTETRATLITAGGSYPIRGHLGSDAIAGIGVAGHTAVIALTADDRIAVVDLAAHAVLRTIRVGIAPFGVVLSRDGRIAYVSNWGGRVPSPGERTGPTGPGAHADRVAIDAQGVDSSGTVSRVDLSSARVTNTIPVGLHPTAMWWNERRDRVYVTNSNSDTVSVVDTSANAVIRTIALRPFRAHVAGISPNAIVGDPRSGHLYVACGGINAVAVVRAGDGSLLGLIPTGWYPVDVALSNDGSTLAVGTLLGVGSGGNVPSFMLAYVKQETGMFAADLHGGRWVHDDRGSVSVLPVPSDAQLVEYTEAVAEANHMVTGDIAFSHAAATRPLPVPLIAGEPSLIDHVVYIIKENRTYDQFFGDLGQGNGDPALAFYGDNEIPNHRRLARQFVLLDNFYASGGNSGDGHQWVTQATETDYVYWPGYDGRSYPFDGSDALAPASSGFIWDDAARHGRTVAIFGEYAGNNGEALSARQRHFQEWKNGSQFVGEFHQVAPLGPVNRFVVHDFPGYGGQVPDVVRARIFIRHLHEWQRFGTMPNLAIVQLPADHTGGTMPGYSTPRACMADNDLALGQIVDALSHSRFWPHMAIFVVEDDAQSGVDHVDGHRTVALAISPYIRRGYVDSTFYDQPSMLKTMELMLGLPPMTLFDRIANDMRASFKGTPDFTPYSAVVPRQSLFAINPPVTSLHGQARRDAVASMHMNFLEADRAPTAILNRILWRDAKGENAAYPVLHHAPLAAGFEGNEP